MHQHIGQLHLQVAMSLDISKHEKYFSLCFQSFPAKAEGEDTNKLALIYFVLYGLDIIGKLNLTTEDQENYSEYIYSHLIDSELTRQLDILSFRPTNTFKLNNEYDLPNLSATFFALINLLILKSDYSKKLNRESIMKFIKKCQREDGSFAPVLDNNGEPFGETDLRHCYLAICIRKLLKYDEASEKTNDIDIKKCINFIESKVNYNGGLSSNKYTESHSGLTFVGLASLKLLNYKFDSDWVELTKNWLVHRQVDYPDQLYSMSEDSSFDNYSFYDLEDIGGFNGRENKFSDTCYSWWVTASLYIIGGDHLFNVDKLIDYLLTQTQNHLLGGFGKSKDVFPDPLHSFLGLASLSLWKHKESANFDGSLSLQDVNELLVITESLMNFLNNIKW